MEFSQETKDFIKKECDRYESRLSAIIPCLYKIQELEGWVSPEAVTALAKESDLPPVKINEVLNFYTMFNTKPVGKLHVQVCNNITCCMLGSRELTDKICNEFSVKPGEVSKDGMVTVSKVECLGSCDTAPMMQVNDAYYENLTADSAVQIIKDLGKKNG